MLRRWNESNRNEADVQFNLFVGWIVLERDRNFILVWCAYMIEKPVAIVMLDAVA